MVSWKRSAIMESLLKLLDERPLNRIVAALIGVNQRFRL